VLLGSLAALSLVAFGAPAALAGGSTVTAYVLNDGAGTVTAVDTSSGKVGATIALAKNSQPDAIAITPNGATLYAASAIFDNVTPITTATGAVGKPIKVGVYPEAIAITPDGATAYVVNGLVGSITPIKTATNTAGPAIAVANATLRGIVMAPSGQTAYVSEYTADDVIPFDTVTNRAGRPISVGGGSGLDAIAITPNGKTVYVTSPDCAAGCVMSVFGFVGLRWGQLRPSLSGRGVLGCVPFVLAAVARVGAGRLRGWRVRPGRVWWSWSWPAGSGRGWERFEALERGGENCGPGPVVLEA
jgi:sugar lactone lactonase YvrE